MRDHNIWAILPLTILVLLSGCNNSVEEASQPLPQDIAPPTSVISVELNKELQSVMALSGNLSVQLSVDDTQAQSMTITNMTAHISLTAEQLQGERQLYVAVQYSENGSDTTVLLAEAEKFSSDSQVRFTDAELNTVPYDKDNSGEIEQAEQQTLDADLDKKSNLAEILLGGNPRNPGPTFLSHDSIQVPEKQSQPNGLYAVYTAKAISPRDDANLSYTIAGGTAADRFTINASSGVLSFVDDNNISWPAFSSGGNNDFTVNIKADDGTLSNTRMVTITITDVFNLQVTIGTKSLNFSWFEVPSADYYKLLENPDGNSGFSEVPGADHIQEITYSYSITAYNFDAPKARYVLQAYDISNNLIKSSAELNITDSILAAVGYFKTPNASADDRIGAKSISLSADGATLAVGAYWEDSGAASTGLNGNPQDDCKNADGSPNPAPTNCATNSGAVYLFQRDGGNSGQWDNGDYAAYIKAPNADAYDYFGVSLSLSADGSTLAVGALTEDSGAAATGLNGNPQDDCKNADGSPNPASTNCATDSGAVYLFQRGGGNSEKWDEGDYAAYIKAPSADADDHFGRHVSLSADGATLAVAAYQDDSGAAATGLNGNPQDDCKNADGSPNPASTNCATNSGAVYLFQRGGGNSGQWDNGDYAAYIKAPNADENDRFGSSVSISADGATLVVGAYLEDSGAANTGLNGDPQDNCQLPDGSTIPSPTNCAINSGAAYVFQRGGGNSGKWDDGDYAAYIKAPNAGAGDLFGSSVSISADGVTLAVGSTREDSGAASTGLNGDPQDDCKNTDGSSNRVSTNCATNSGAVYLFQRSGGNSEQWDDGDYAAYIKAPNAGAGDLFGSSVSISADGVTLAVGSQSEDSGGVGTSLNGNPQDDCQNADGSTNPAPSNCAPNSGAVHLFRQSGGTSGQWGDGDYASYIKAPNADANDLFGISVNLSADAATLVVGASGEDSGAASTGLNGNPIDDCYHDDGSPNPASTNCAIDSGAVYLY